MDIVKEVFNLIEKINIYINKIQNNDKIKNQLNSKILIIRNILNNVINDDENSEIVMNIKFVLTRIKQYIEKRNITKIFFLTI